MCEQPTLGRSDWAAPAGAGCASLKLGYDVSKKSGKEVLDSSKKPEKEVFDSSEIPHLSERDVKYFLYVVSRYSEFSEPELQAIHAVVKGVHPRKKLSESQAKETRDLLDMWKKDGEFLRYEMRFESFDTEEERQQKLEKLKKQVAAEELKRANRKPQYCEVCMKDVQHLSFECPYLRDVPDPDNTPVGEGYVILCHHCFESDHGHPKGTWPGFAFDLSTTMEERMRIRDEEEEEEEEEEEDPDEESYDEPSI